MQFETITLYLVVVKKDFDVAQQYPSNVPGFARVVNIRSQLIRLMRILFSFQNNGTS